MNKNKFFEKFIEKLSQLDESKIKLYLESVESERRTFKQILDYLDDALMVVDKDKIVFLNNEAERVLISPHIKLPVAIEEARKIFSNFQLFNFIVTNLSRDDYKTEFLNDNMGKKYYYIEKITTEGQFNIIKIKDITENKLLEFQLKNLESISALNTLAAGIAHEIKNPLTAIDLHTQIIKKGIEKKMIEVPEEVLNYIHIIDEEQKRLIGIVNDFLTSARKRVLKLSFEDINEYLQNILMFIEPEIQENSIELVHEWSTIPKIFIDKDYLRQAVLNLLKNSIEAVKSNANAYSNNKKTKKIIIKTFYDIGSDSIGISIIDNGPGIENEKLQKIFEPYYTTKEYGTGLGLTIVYKIVQEHGGEIKVESEKGKGSKFTIYLPTIIGTKMISH